MEWPSFIENINFHSKNMESEEAHGYTVIGSSKRFKLEPVKAAIPEWILNSDKFNGDINELDDGTDGNPISSLNDVLANNLDRIGIKRFFPVQSKLIPYLLNSFKSSQFKKPNDVCVSSPTGK